MGLCASSYGAGRETMVEFIKKMFTKHREFIMYGIFGVLTTAVNYVVYLGAAATGMHYMVANVVAWIVAVVFAYVVNRKWVFESRSPELLPEFLRFVGSRLLSLVVESGAMYVMVDLIHMDDKIAKLVGIVINVIINYFLGKIFVFKKPQNPAQTGQDSAK